VGDRLGVLQGIICESPVILSEKNPADGLYLLRPLIVMSCCNSAAKKFDVVVRFLVVKFGVCFVIFFEVGVPMEKTSGDCTGVKN